MPEPDLVEIFAAPLHRSGAHYLVAGSVGAMVYSEPRLTIDIDLAVVLGDATLAPLPHLIALKLYAGGTKSKADILELLLRNPELDVESVRQLCRSYRLSGLDALIEEARSLR